ncbi:GIY-YIG nuclease family protein [Leifsonia sp. fls2-241-R2A-40a]|uniref:GIY-YIG nuclease family protein n=1 Tax=Leifsonia sp. fls2-241-R2A-40a TaxID=3040290 RepID=UPI002550F1D1|nr:GIY-YIG nuclease family protein [Leifsonia sp. fls2-241-R2A-40a]
MPPRSPSQRTVIGATVEHLGERVRAGKYGFRLTRDVYAVPSKRNTKPIPREFVSDEMWEEMSEIYEDDDHRIYTDAWVAEWHDAVLENFDLNMAWFENIEPSAFEAVIAGMLAAEPKLQEVTDLRPLDGVSGVYVMVLDGYRQVYIGQATDIRARIKRHWSGVKQFDRLLWAHKHESVMSIDSFRALDTTRVFAVRTGRPDMLEQKLVEAVPADYRLNRISGGTLSGLRGLFILGEINRRNLTSESVGP